MGTATANAGGSWTASLAVLALGTHTLTAKVQDPVSGFWSASSSSFTVTVKPDAPSIASISTPGPTTTSTSVTVSGTGTIGSTVKVYEGSTLRGTVVVGSGGAWSVSVTLTVGGHSLTATQTTGSFTSDPSAPASVTVYSPPSAPSSISSDDGAVSAGATVYGHSVAGGNVEVYEGSTLVGTATANAGGSWTAVLAILALGRHTLTARVQDPVSGFWSSSSSSFTVTVDPDAPGITSVSTPPATTTSTSVTVSGTGVTGYTVKVYDGSTFKATVVVGSGGAWSVSVSLTVGTHSLTATQTSTPVGGSTFTSDNSGATTVTVYAPTSAPFSISTNGATPSTNATVSGRSVGLGSVEVYEGSTLIATATASSGGNWTATLPLLSVGRHTLTARVQDPNSGFWSGSSSSFTVTIVPDAPAITSVPTPGPATPTAPVTVNGTGVTGYTVKLYDGSYFVGSGVVGAGGVWTIVVNLYPGNHSLSATQTSTPVGGSTFTSDASAAAAVTVYAPPFAPWSISVSGATVLTTATAWGNSVAGGTVEIYEGSTLIATTTASAGGDWLTTLPFLALGSHTLRARVQDPTSGFWSSLSSSFTVAVTPETVVISSVSPLGPTSATARVTGTGTAGDTVKVYDGSTFLGSGVIAADGTWSVDVNVAAGNRVLSATQTSPFVGLSTFTSVPSNLAQLTVPVAPVITSAPAAVVTGTTATVGGQGIAGATLKLYDGGVEAGTVTVAPNGSWTATLTLGAVGNHVLTVKQQDPVSGYWSAYGPSVQVAVNPNAPAITSVSTPGPASPTASVTVSGTGVAGYSVKVYDGGSLKATVTVAADGTWTATVALSPGSRSLTATQTATVGGSTFTSAASAVASVTVYAPPPAPPVTASPSNVFVGAAFAVSGYGVVGATVRIYDAGIEIGSAVVASNGTWTTTLSLPSVGGHALSVKQQDPISGFWSAGSAITVTAFADPGPPVISTVSTPSHTHSTTSVTVTGTGVAGQTITLYDGSNSIKTVVVAANGTWSTTVSLGVGTHTLTATQSPAAGLQSAPSAARTVTVLWG